MGQGSVKGGWPGPGVRADVAGPAGRAAETCRRPGACSTHNGFRAHDATGYGRLSGGRARPFGIVRFGEDWPERIRGRPLPEPERSLAGPGCPPGSAGPTAMGTGRERAEMKRTRLFAQALGLERPWYVESTAFDAGERRLDIHLNFEVGGTFACGGCGGEGCKAYDTALKEWRHLNFFQHQACLHAPSPRVKCPECGVRQARLPWARPRSGFTLLFEALVVTMASGMPVKAVARIVEEHDTRLWRIVKHHVDEARAEADHSQVRAAGVDERRAAGAAAM